MMSSLLEDLLLEQESEGYSLANDEWLQGGHLAAVLEAVEKVRRNAGPDLAAALEMEAEGQQSNIVKLALAQFPEMPLMISSR